MQLLIIVDMQNDFISGSLGTAEAKDIVTKAAAKIRAWEGDIICTRDTHGSNYLDTAEGKNLPVLHCVAGTEGHALNQEVQEALSGHRGVRAIDKHSFGSLGLPQMVGERGYERIELLGLCTDICVISNAMILKAAYPETEIAVDASCCAGVTPQSHRNALAAMKMCQISILGE